MAFINIVPRTKSYLEYSVSSVPLRVVKGDGVKTTPDIDIKVTDLSEGQKHFVNNSGEGDKFKITVVINKNETITGVFETTDMVYPSDYTYNWAENKGKLWHFEKVIPLIDALDYWIRNMVIITVFSDNNDAVDIPDGNYIVTGNPSRKQDARGGNTLWELEFTKYTGVTVLQFNEDNTYVNKAIQAYNKNKSKNTAKAKKSSSVNNKLSKCKISQLQYSKTKKTVACVKLLQKVLKKKGYYKDSIDGWYGNSTKSAVKAFQTAVNKRKEKTIVIKNSVGKITNNSKKLNYKLNANGKMDKDTLKVLCES